MRQLLLCAGAIVLCVAACSCSTKKNELPQPNASGQMEDNPVPPQGARWTLACRTFTGPMHQQEARQIKSQLMGMSNLKSWYVVHAEGESTLYYGYYRSYNDPNDLDETHRAQEDRAKVASVMESIGGHRLPAVIFVELSSSDPQAPPEWNLLNAKGYYTLVIASYAGDMRRKQAAVDSVREARKMGIEAYYYHGSSSSDVCIGAWPKEAARVEEVPSGPVADRRQSVLVLPSQVPNLMDGSVKDSQGNPIKVVAPKFQPLDPSLIKMMREYPVYSVNGDEVENVVVDPATHAKVRVPQPTFVAYIPHGQSVATQGRP